MSEVALTRAEHFLRLCIHDSLAHSWDTATGKWVKPYPEVTGYLLRYSVGANLFAPEIVRSIADRLLSLQDQSGGFPSFYDTHLLYAFDTAQILSGLLSAYSITQTSEYLEAARRAGEFLIGQQIESGAIFPIYDTHNHSRVVFRLNRNGQNWGSHFSYIQVKDVESLFDLAHITGEFSYQHAARKLISWGLDKIDPRFTHPLGYYLEGMWRAGKKKLVKEILQKYIIPRVAKNGFIPYYKNAEYAYVSGSMQLGKLLAQSGFKNVSRRIVEFGKTVQDMHTSGGLYQYADCEGRPYTDIHGEINSWGTKYFAELLRILVK